MQTINYWVLATGLMLMTTVSSAPSVYPTGTTRYVPDEAWNGFTVLTPLSTQAALVIDMNGNLVKRWDGFVNSAGAPVRVLPGGDVVSAVGAHPPHQEALALEQRDFDGNLVWRFERNEQVELRDGGTVWSSRQHHDWQRDDFPAGYYSPDFTPARTGARTLLLTHTNHVLDSVAPGVTLEDDRIIEIDWDGEILWEWTAGEHIDEFGFAADARAVIASAPGQSRGRGDFDWLHINSATYLGPNPWYAAGDQRFAPENIIISSRQASLVAIIDRSGAVVWQIGPDFRATPALRAIRQMVGQHHAHLIPPGLPGAGNVMIFDNGGSSGYGFDSPIAVDGVGALARATSRILEIDPVTLELVWSYAAPGFFSTNISGAQRLANGNTLVTEGATGRLFEVTAEREIVWEYMSPFFAGPGRSNTVYRAYRVPYEWLPQLEVPAEIAVTPPPAETFTVP